MASKYGMGNFILIAYCTSENDLQCRDGHLHFGYKMSCSLRLIDAALPQCDLHSKNLKKNFLQVVLLLIPEINKVIVKSNYSR